MIDSVDRKILTILQKDARAPNAVMAREVGLTPAAVHARVKKLEARGVITGYAARLSPEALGYSFLAFISVTLAVMRRADEAAAAFETMGEILEVHHTVGEACFLLKARCRDSLALESLLARINDLEPVRATQTIIALRTSKETINPPLPE